MWILTVNSIQRELFLCWLEVVLAIIVKFHLKADLTVVLSAYWATAVLCSIPGSAWNLSFRAAQAAFSLLDEVQLFIQRVLLKLELLQDACGGLQFLLQSEDGAVFRFDFIHLQSQRRKQHLSTCFRELIYISLYPPKWMSLSHTQSWLV